MMLLSLLYGLTCGQRDAPDKDESFAVEKSKVTTARHLVLQYSSLEGRDGRNVLYRTPAFSRSRAGDSGIRVITSPVFLVTLEQHCHPVARMRYCYQPMSSLWFVSVTVAWQRTGFRKASGRCERRDIPKHFSFIRVNNVSD